MTQPRIVHHSAADGYRLAARVWPVARPRASIVFLHGIISHGGWYTSSCRHLANAGFDVHFLDRRGAGLNAAGRGDCERFDTWLTDVEGYLESLPTERPRLLMGISWGGKVATSVARRRPELVDGLGLICPGLFATRGANFWQRVALRLAGSLGLGGLRVTIPLREPSLFTGVRRWQEFIASDPLTLRRISIRFTLADLRLNAYATAQPESIHTPTLLIQAGRDRIIRNAAVERFVNGFGTADRTVITFADAAHTFEFEPDPTAYLRSLEEWASERAKG